MEERKMEQWNGGIMEEWVKSKKNDRFPHYSSIPSFHRAS
jgi:hypothetical protein